MKSKYSKQCKEDHPLIDDASLAAMCSIFPTQSQHLVKWTEKDAASSLEIVEQVSLDFFLKVIVQIILAYAESKSTLLDAEWIIFLNLDSLSQQSSSVSYSISMLI